MDIRDLSQQRNGQGVKRVRVQGDPARQRWLAAWRQARFAHRILGCEIELESIILLVTNHQSMKRGKS